MIKCMRAYKVAYIIGCSAVSMALYVPNHATIAGKYDEVGLTSRGSVRVDAVHGSQEGGHNAA